MKNKRNKRWRLFADVRLQGLMIVRMAIYWIFCQIALVGTILAMSSLAEGTGESTSMVEMHFIIPALTVSTFVFPLFVFDMLVFSNRFTGPIVNLRRKMKQLADNDTCEELSFRKGDYFMDLAQQFNQIREKLQSPSPQSEANPTSSFFPTLETTNPTGTESHV